MNMTNQTKHNEAAMTTSFRKALAESVKENHGYALSKEVNGIFGCYSFNLNRESKKPDHHFLWLVFEKRADKAKACRRAEEFMQSWGEKCSVLVMLASPDKARLVYVPKMLKNGKVKLFQVKGL